MVGAAFAAVPLYNWFCRTTGFGGTTQVAKAAPAHDLDAQDHGALRRQCGRRPAVAFEPEQHDRGSARRGRDGLLQGHQRIGARHRRARRPTMSAPPTVGVYFKKINCFCFTEQTLKPGETRDMAVVFFVDPGSPRIPNRTISTPSRCPTRSIRCANRTSRWRRAAARASSRAYLRTATQPALTANERQRGDNDDGRWRTRQTAPRLPPGRSEPVAGGRLDLGVPDGRRRHPVDASHRRLCAARSSAPA